MWIFEKLLEDFRDVCEQGSVLIISGSTEHDFSATIFIKLSKLSKFTIIIAYKDICGVWF